MGDAASWADSMYVFYYGAPLVSVFLESVGVIFPVNHGHGFFIPVVLLLDIL